MFDEGLLVLDLYEFANYPLGTITAQLTVTNQIGTNSYVVYQESFQIDIVDSCLEDVLSFEQSSIVENREYTVGDDPKSFSWRDAYVLSEGDLKTECGALVWEFSTEDGSELDSEVFAHSDKSLTVSTTDFEKAQVYNLRVRAFYEDYVNVRAE